MPNVPSETRFLDYASVGEVSDVLWVLFGFADNQRKSFVRSDELLPTLGLQGFLPLKINFKPTLPETLPPLPYLCSTVSLRHHDLPADFEFKVRFRLLGI